MDLILLLVLVAALATTDISAQWLAGVVIVYLIIVFLVRPEFIQR